jgi:SAM-dependent methyltransferase
VTTPSPGAPETGVPSRWISRFAAAIRPHGCVLDLAAGSGRHTRLLLDLGFEVVAVDRHIGDLAAAFAATPRCRIVGLDLENGGDWRLGGGFDAVVVANYLHRPLLPDLARALAPGGVLIYETFLLGNELFGKPGNPDFLLRPNELLEAYAGTLTILGFEQGIVATPRLAAVQRLAAINGPAAALP